MLEECPVEEVVDFCLEVGLPVALEDIGLEGVGPRGAREGRRGRLHRRRDHPQHALRGPSRDGRRRHSRRRFRTPALCSKERRACPPWRPSRRTVRSHPKAHGESRIRRDRKPVGRGRAGTSGASPVRPCPRASGGSRPRFSPSPLRSAARSRGRPRGPARPHFSPQSSPLWRRN
jgi:hypothetical protein